MPELIYRDDQIAVINKPPGLLSVPGKGPDKQDCVSRYIKEAFPCSIEQPSVHRLDMDTSGLMVFALTADAHRHLSVQFQKRQVNKKYIALVDGHLKDTSGRIELKFRLDPENRPMQVYDPLQGKAGITEWKRLSTEGALTRIEFIPLTGRTHQLRVHSAHKLGLGCPIAGDRLYGSGAALSSRYERMMLHASELGFIKPGTNSRLFFELNPEF